MQKCKEYSQILYLYQDLHNKLSEIKEIDLSNPFSIALRDELCAYDALLCWITNFDPEFCKIMDNRFIEILEYPFKHCARN